MVDFRDDELKKWLAEEYEREIDEMEKVLFPDGVLPDDGETEEEAKAAYQKLVARLKADGVYEEDEENGSKEADDHKADTKEKIVYLPEKRHHKLARVAAVVLVCAAGVFAAGMTSQANRSYFIDSVKIWRGNDTSISVDNDTMSDEVDRDEQSAIDDIANQLELDKIPKFMYRPENFKYKNYIHIAIAYQYHPILCILVTITICTLSISAMVRTRNEKSKKKMVILITSILILVLSIIVTIGVIYMYKWEMEAECV